jgi:hypothetical protein
MGNQFVKLRYLASAGFCIGGLYNLYMGKQTAAKTLLFIRLIGLSSTVYIHIKHRKKELL